MTGSLGSYIYCRFSLWMSLFSVSCHQRVTVLNFMSPVIGLVVVVSKIQNPWLSTFRVSRMGNGGFWRSLQQEGFDQFDRFLEL